MRTISNNLLYPFSAFLAGFSLMVVELVAARILAPMVGSSIYTWTAVIGIIMLGMVVGNFSGGYLIDKHPNKKILYFIFLLAALSTAAIPLFALFSRHIVLLPISLPLIIILLSVSLFILPAVFFGAAYPSILKLYVQSVVDVGKKSGKISALWSLGSILGTFMTGFFFIGYIGSNSTLYTVSFVLLLNALLLFPAKTRSSFFYFFLILLSIHITNIANDKRELVYQKESNYYNIKIIDTKDAKESNTRIMFLDFDAHSMEGADDSNAETYINSPPIFSAINSGIRDILIIGGGSQSISKVFSKLDSDTRITTVEIDPAVTNAAAKFFKSPERPIKTVSADGRVFLAKSNEKYDLIFSDAYNSFISVPWHLATKEFNELALSRLNKDGVYAVNFISARTGENSLFFQTMLETFKQTFSNYHMFAYGKSPNEAQNIILVGVNSSLSMNADDLYAKLLKLENGSIYAKLLVPDPESLLTDDSIKPLSDNFAPTEKLMSPLIKNYFSRFSAQYYSIF